MVRWLGGCVLLGVVTGVLWWLLAPVGDVVRADGHLRAVGDPELLAGMDVTYGVLTALAGVLVAAVLVSSGTRRVVLRSGLAVAGGVLGAVVAWQVGRWLGPGPLPVVADGGAHPAPLDVRATGLLLAWPTVTAALSFVLMTVRSFRTDAP